MRLFNTLTRQIEEFKPITTSEVTLYSCGPTVYNYTHIGHIRSFTSVDILKRSLSYVGYNVKHVMNITDVGHLTGDNEGDADLGEDKLEKGARTTGKTVWEVAEYYTDYFKKTLKALHILDSDILSKATEHIPEMIKLIKILQEKGYTYETNEAVYFDITKFPSYGKLSGQKLEDKIKGAREEVNVDTNKKNPADFALWFKRVGRFADHTMHWDSPWGDGFPGWHIECSAMSMKYLGETIDIHTGGIEHIPVHHENEIAQSEAATGKQFVKYWVHFHHLQVNGEKMSKSLGNFYTVDDIEKEGIDPVSLRLLFLQTHYRQPMNFTWEAARGTHEAYKRLKEQTLELQKNTSRAVLSNEKLNTINKLQQKFREALENDLQTPQAVAVVWEMLKSNIPSEDKLDLLYEFDQVLGLNLRNIKEEDIPDEILDIIREREKARQEKDFKKSDELRELLQQKGYVIKDMKGSYKITKI